jgi:hypothetical protein
MVLQRGGPPRCVLIHGYMYIIDIAHLRDQETVISTKHLSLVVTTVKCPVPLPWCE